MNDRERNQAIKEAHNIAASQAYFGARSMFPLPAPHTIFDAGFSRGWDAAMLASAPPSPQVVPRKIPTPPPQAEMLDVVYAEGWNQCCDTFFGGLPPQEPVVITITESAPPAPQAEPSCYKHDESKKGCAWCDKQASVVKQEPVAQIVYASDEQGNVEWLVHSGRPIRVGQMLYTHPAPVREPLTDDGIIEIAKNPMTTPCSPWWLKDEVILGDVRQAALVFARAIEAAHGITKDTPKPRKASADFDLPAPNDDIGDTL